MHAEPLGLRGAQVGNLCFIQMYLNEAEVVATCKDHSTCKGSSVVQWSQCCTHSYPLNYIRREMHVPLRSVR